MQKIENTRIHIRCSERTRKRLQNHAKLMSWSLSRQVTVGEWLGHLLDDMDPTRMGAIRERLKTEQAQLEVSEQLKLVELAKMSDQTEQILGEYTAGEVYDVRVTVRWLESEYDSEEEMNHNYVHVRCEVWAGDTGTLDYPDHWQIDWVHYVNVIAGGFERFLTDFCPFEDAVEDVLDTASKVPLPDELRDLFPIRERKVESVNRHTVSQETQSLLARLQAVKKKGDAA